MKLLRSKKFHTFVLTVLSLLFVVVVIGLWWLKPTLEFVPGNPVPNIFVSGVWLGPIIPFTEQIASTSVPYIQIIDSCGPYFQGSCVRMRSGPGTEYSVVEQLRNNVVLRVADATTTEDGMTWYKIAQDSSVRYPERITSDWYVAAPYAKFFYENPDQMLAADSPQTNKRIVVSLSKEMLYAYDGDQLFMEAPISKGLNGTPTPRGTFRVYKMTPSRYMQGPLPGVSDQYYDLPGVPWNLYFSVDGAVIHGAYWHDHFGQPWSHGCVNLSPENAEKLYNWADIGMPVTIQN